MRSSPHNAANVRLRSVHATLIDSGFPLSRRLAAIVVALAVLATPAWAQQDRIERLIRDADLGPATVAVHAVELGSGRDLVAIDHQRPMIPASNMKLLTTGAALTVLGPDFVYRTELILDGRTLIWRGSGDPALADHRMLEHSGNQVGVDGLLDAMADAIAATGIDRIDEIVIDDRVLDRQWIHPGWPGDQLDRHYSAAVSGLNLAGNVMAYFTTPASTGIGDPPRFHTEPQARWIQRSTDVTARTARSGGNRVWIRRDPELNRFTLGGSVQHPSGLRLRVAVHEPPLWAGRLLAERLTSAGLKVGDGSSPAPGVPGGVRLADPGEQLASGRVIAVVTTPLADVVTLCNRDSINLYAEAMLKRLAHDITGGPGSWTRGAAVVRMVIQQRLGHEHAARTIVDDGSGLSRSNRVTPATLTAWLADLARDPSLGELFIASLAVPGDGTLQRRFGDVELDNDVHAKSGSINGVRTLSGYVLDHATDQGIAFSVLVNDLPLTGSASTKARQLHEDIVEVLDDWLAESIDAARHAEASEPADLGG